MNGPLTVIVNRLSVYSFVIFQLGITMGSMRRVFAVTFLTVTDLHQYT